MNSFINFNRPTSGFPALIFRYSKFWNRQLQLSSINEMASRSLIGYEERKTDSSHTFSPRVRVRTILPQFYQGVIFLSESDWPEYKLAQRPHVPRRRYLNHAFHLLDLEHQENIGKNKREYGYLHLRSIQKIWGAARRDCIGQVEKSVRRSGGWAQATSRQLQCVRLRRMSNVAV